MKEKILIADDEESIRFTFSSFLNGAGYQVESVASLSACIKKMQTEPFDLLFLDISLGLENSIESIEGLKSLQPQCVVVAITGAPDSKTINKVRRNGAVDCLAKPVRQSSLLYIADKVLSHKRQ